ncbi:sensor histidine kinase [Saccharicrinis fermentans]|uniref:histidine kinase n=1 Tax=Saccharicrinis fermentans DSM 9555 = JCM 21142 TaxID=869213 RepID=W7Y0P7_9BACT|nr:ATP-binding protein [Saccharicrinis fermentans]GAF01527.1 virulence sensor protein BvgS precursor [Saccharicrinis fermentans DSM 9555 = JCM 21142]
MMGNNEDKFTYEELLERVKQLEFENESMAERAGEVLLLSVLGDALSVLEDKNKLIEELLEKVSILKNIPHCYCYEWIEGKFKLIESYTVMPDVHQCPTEIILSEEVVRGINEHGVYCGCAQEVIHAENEWAVSETTEVLIIRFHNNWVNSGVFLFLDEKSGFSLETKYLVIRQAVNMVLEQIEKLEYIKEIEQLNKDLEDRVVERTEALVEMNSKLLNEIEERKVIEEELRYAKDKAQESDRLKSIFLANMSHEIRTPMNAIVGFSELMESGTCDEKELREFTRLIYGNSLSLLNLINDLLDFSKIEANQLSLHRSTCNVNEILDDVRSLGETLLKQYKKENLSIRIHKSVTDEEAHVFTDSLRLKQILINLLSNAIKFSFEGQIVIEYKIEKENVCFAVKDQGIGIADKMQALIFKRFSRVSDDINKPIAGNGLGLTITKTLVEMLGGVIGVESEIGRGSIFKFSILR